MRYIQRQREHCALFIVALTCMENLSQVVTLRVLSLRCAARLATVDNARTHTHSPFFVFETPTLSTHSKESESNPGDSSPSRNSMLCSSCGGGTAGRGGHRYYADGSSSGINSRELGGGAWGRPAGIGGGLNDRSPPYYYRAHHHHDGQRNQQPDRRNHSPQQWSPTGSTGDVGGATVVTLPGASASVAGKKQARRAASLLYSSLRFASAVKHETLPPGG